MESLRWTWTVLRMAHPSRDTSKTVPSQSGPLSREYKQGSSTNDRGNLRSTRPAAPPEVGPSAGSANPSVAIELTILFSEASLSGYKE